MTAPLPPDIHELLAEVVDLLNELEHVPESTARLSAVLDEITRRIDLWER